MISIASLDSRISYRIASCEPYRTAGVPRQSRMCIPRWRGFVLLSKGFCHDLHRTETLRPGCARSREQDRNHPRYVRCASSSCTMKHYSSASDASLETCVARLQDHRLARLVGMDRIVVKKAAYVQLKDAEQLPTRRTWTHVRCR
jgi:hypothetical protein